MHKIAGNIITDEQGAMRNGSAYRQGHILILKSIKVHKSSLQPIHVRERAHIVSAIV